MPNVGGPIASKRRLLMAVTVFILLYGYEIWVDILKMEKFRKRMASVQRRGALRVASSYRTVPETVVLVIVGIISIDLLTLEQNHLFKRRYEIGIYVADH